MYLAISQQQGYQGFFILVFTTLELIFNSIIIAKA